MIQWDSLRLLLYYFPHMDSCRLFNTTLGPPTIHRPRQTKSWFQTWNNQDQRSQHWNNAKVKNESHLRIWQATSKHNEKGHQRQCRHRPRLDRLWHWYAPLRPNLPCNCLWYSAAPTVPWLWWRAWRRHYTCMRNEECKCRLGRLVRMPSPSARVTRVRGCNCAGQQRLTSPNVKIPIHMISERDLMQSCWLMVASKYFVVGW